jgi:heparan-alpha-glucosaminide N-acetyltransferase
MTTNRLKSIDILRALTMLLMIFVNDLWTLTDIPGWLEHKAAHEDGMGLADVVFPAFLFIVGLSIPLAIRARFKKGDSRLLVLRHIIERTLALLIMGVLMVNLEHIDREHLLFSRSLWQILMTLAFFLIWNTYGARLAGRFNPWILKGLGWAILIFLCITYTGTGNGGGEWMRFRWWGILGLIGWGYLAGALTYLLLGNRPGWVSLVLVLFILLNVNEFVTPFNFTIKLIVSASNHTLVLAGVLVTSVMIRLREQGRIELLVGFLGMFAIILVLFGFLTRPIWGISKIMATPSWTAICAGITTLAFLVLHLLTDRLNLYRWAGIIKAAGTSTLTCYLVPYFVYAFREILNIELPGPITTGGIGILKSLLFAIVIIQITGLLGRANIRLKI